MSRLVVVFGSVIVFLRSICGPRKRVRWRTGFRGPSLLRRSREAGIDMNSTKFPEFVDGGSTAALSASGSRSQQESIDPSGKREVRGVIGGAVTRARDSGFGVRLGADPAPEVLMGGDQLG